MKIPGIGEVKNKTAAIGGSAFGAFILYAYYRRKKNANAVAAAATAIDPNAVDPQTGIPYNQETGYSQASPGTGIPYVSNVGAQVPSTTGATNNEQWLNDAEQVAQNTFGASYSLATTAFGAYLRQDPKGMQIDAYNLVSEVVAAIGQPPIGGPYRLIQGSPPQNPSSNPPPDNESPPPPPTDPHAGMHLQAPQVATLSAGTSLAKYASATGQSLTILESYNPGLNPNQVFPTDRFIRTSNERWVAN